MVSSNEVVRSNDVGGSRVVLGQRSIEMWW